MSCGSNIIVYAFASFNWGENVEKFAILWLIAECKEKYAAASDPNTG